MNATMMAKAEFAGASGHVFDRGDRGLSRPEAWIYGGLTLGLVAGAAISTYVWRQKVKAAELLNLSPLERAEQLIAACEQKLDKIEDSVRELQEKN